MTSEMQTDSLEALYGTLATQSFDAGWNKVTPSLYPEPKKNYLPAHWRYRDGRAALERAGHLVDTELAERRNLIMFNPREGNRYGTSPTLVAAYQMLLPGEHARSHRHTPNALRLIVEGDAGSYTAVDGKRITMLPGDVVLTPSWSWHGHGNGGDIPAYWIDFLDVPLVQALEPMFFEPHPDEFEAGAVPVESSPFRFAWTWTESELSRAKPEASGRFGREVTLDAPSLRTMRLHMDAHAAGSTPATLRTTATNIYSVVSGNGSTTIDGTTFDWERGDVFVAPSWRAHQHRIESDAVLFRVSDEPLMEMIGMLREER
jgi:gentisate 1,2-dioxygenase